MGTPWCLPHGILGNVAKHYGIWVSLSRLSRPSVDRLKTLPSPSFGWRAAKRLFKFNSYCDLPQWRIQNFPGKGSEGNPEVGAPIYYLENDMK